MLQPLTRYFAAKISGKVVDLMAVIVSIVIVGIPVVLYLKADCSVDVNSVFW